MEAETDFVLSAAKQLAPCPLFCTQLVEESDTFWNALRSFSLSDSRLSRAASGSDSDSLLSSVSVSGPVSGWPLRFGFSGIISYSPVSQMIMLPVFGLAVSIRWFYYSDQLGPSQLNHLKRIQRAHP